MWWIFNISLAFLIAGICYPIAIYECTTLDLTHSLDNANPYLPMRYRPFSLEYKQRGPLGEVPYVEWNSYCTHEHVGTHLDAPSHYSDKGLQIHAIPLDKLIGEACVIDVSERVRSRRDYAVSLEDVAEWEERHGSIGPSCIVLLHTGQGRFWNNLKDYLGTTNIYDLSTYRYAGFSEEVAKLLVKRDVRAVGVDGISLDTSQTRGYPVQTVLSQKGNIPGVVNLINLDKLPPRGATIIVTPIKIKSGSGAQVRAMALGWNGTKDPCHQDNLSQMSSSALTLTSNALQFVLSVCILLICM